MTFHGMDTLGYGEESRRDSGGLGWGRCSGAKGDPRGLGAVMPSAS